MFNAKWHAGGGVPFGVLGVRQLIRSLLDAARRGERTLVMGILNVTPDSFSDGGRFHASEDAIRRAEAMVAEGADIVDVGGESTRPGAEPLSEEEEIRRILPVIEALAARMPISVDTYKAEVAERAVQAGAAMVNDISALRFDPSMAPAAARLDVPICLMHSRGSLRDMHRSPQYRDVVGEVKAELKERVEAALDVGIAPENIVLDPGFGFSKNAQHNLELLRRLREVTELGYPLLVGTSRKSTIGKVLGGLPVEDRLEGTAATVALSIANGASIVRVHDVKEMVRVARMTDAVVRGNWKDDEVMR